MFSGRERLKIHMKVHTSLGVEEVVDPEGTNKVGHSSQDKFLRVTTNGSHRGTVNYDDTQQSIRKTLT